MGDRCKHTLCAWHLAKQLPNAIEIEGNTLKGQEIKKIFYDTARGTITPLEDLKFSLGTHKELFSKLERIKDKWCRIFTQGLRRDYIVTLSEGLNGVIKRSVYTQTQVALAKEFLAQSRRAYEECKQSAEKILGGKLMPLAYRYYEIDIDFAKHLSYRKEGDTFIVLYMDKQVAAVKKEKGIWKCNCGQYEDLGTPCPHILCVEKVPPHEYTHKMWRASTFKKAFNITIEPRIQHLERTTALLTAGQKKIIDAVKKEFYIRKNSRSCYPYSRP